MILISRITKEPDIRKQEILDTAMKLFSQKGFEQTTISDIAKNLGVSQGLCYRYFKSKHELFDIGLEKYANYFVMATKQGFSDKAIPLKDRLLASPNFFELEKKLDDSYLQFFYKPENKQYQILLSHRICKKMCPILSDMLKEATEQGEYSFNQPDTIASFLLFGQLGILLDESRSESERVKELTEFISSIIDKYL